MQLDQLPAFASPERVELVIYLGGHMFYSRKAVAKILLGRCADRANFS
jgi:hypothetical protein